MRKFLIRLSIFFAIFFCVDYVFGTSFSLLQKKNRSGLTGRDNYIMNDCDEDIIIMGSSRASHHYNSQMIADSLGMKCYNAGRDGNGIIFSYGLLTEMIRHHKPSILIYDLNPDFDWREGDDSTYLPHLRSAYGNISIKQLFEDIDSTEKYKMLSHTYRINSLIPHIIYDSMNRDIDKEGGYIPLLGERKRPFDGVINDSNTSSFDSIKVKYLNEFISLCKENDIELIFSISPMGKVGLDYFEYGKDLSCQKDIRCIDFRDSSIDFSDYTLYQDVNHLNKQGADLYTSYVVSVLHPQNMRISK